MPLDVEDKPELTREIAVSAIRDFFREKPFLFFGTGMSCALDLRFGMPALRDELLKKVRESALAGEEGKQWGGVEAALKDGKDLESALDGVNDVNLLRKVTAITGRFVAGLDREHSIRLASGAAEWPATRLVKRLVDALPEGDRTLHALTPNYDMLFEYGCDGAGVPYSNGFLGGVERKINWDAVDRSLYIPEQVRQQGRLRTVYKFRKHVRLYKVHGSLNYFYHKDCVVENNAWMWDPPEFASRVIITPGLSKYETLQRYRQELLRSADAAIDKANHFLFLGYGFNDRHLEEYIKRKLTTQGCKGLIITRDSNPRIEALLAAAPNLWLVCKEDGKEGTRIFNRQYVRWLGLPDDSLWQVGEFVKEVLGD